MAVRPLRSNRDFTIFWGVQALSELGNAFSLVALPLLVLHATGSAAQMGLLTAIAGVGSILTGLFGGTFADRFDRRKILMLSDAARLVLYGTIPICWAISPQIWVLYVVMGLASIFEMLFSVTYVTAVSNLVDNEQITEANGKLEATNAIAYIAGPALAGLVAGLFGATAAITINAASFGVSVLGLAVIRLRPTERPAAAIAQAGAEAGTEVGPEAGRRTGTGTGTRRGWRTLHSGFVTGAAFLWRSPVLRTLTVLLTITTFLNLGMTDVMIYQVRHGLGQSERTVGYVLALSGLGTCIAAAATARLRRGWGFGACWLASYTLCGLAVLLLALTGNVTLAAASAFLYGFGMSLAGICSMSLRQQVTPDHLLGRVTSAFWTIHSSLAPLGAFLLTALVGRFGARGPLIGVAVVLLLLVGAALFTPIRQRAPERSFALPAPNPES
ncbi:MFS transporter [Kitasatospora kifunensis]|uniref:MFS family permease n=1 Tax=Kitasatospora kifunensis TaxID=58351 RepID=A0A7W7W0H5_KITKI|nr:MFS transporter [Kitasatospora kifunensis]MBB4928754.1 MFS family permease [Kitasatospora kifunensis]